MKPINSCLPSGEIPVTLAVLNSLCGQSNQVTRSFSRTVPGSIPAGSLPSGCCFLTTNHLSGALAQSRLSQSEPLPGWDVQSRKR